MAVTFQIIWRKSSYVGSQLADRPRRGCGGHSIISVVGCVMNRATTPN